MRPSSDVFLLLCFTKFRNWVRQKRGRSTESESSFWIKVSKQLSLASSAIFLEPGMAVIQMLYFCCAKQNSLILYYVLWSDCVPMGAFRGEFLQGFSKSLFWFDSGSWLENWMEVVFLPYYSRTKLYFSLAQYRSTKSEILWYKLVVLLPHFGSHDDALENSCLQIFKSLVVCIWVNKF